MVPINSSGDYAWRADLYDYVGEQLGENTKAGAIDGACELSLAKINDDGSVEILLG